MLQKRTINHYNFLITKRFAERNNEGNKNTRAETLDSDSLLFLFLWN